MTINFHHIYPGSRGELEILFAKYPYKVEIRLDHLTRDDAHTMEEWCEELYGKLDEYDPTSPWQVSYNLVNFKPGLAYEALFFYFWNEEQAVAFKLRWT